MDHDGVNLSGVRRVEDPISRLMCLGLCDTASDLPARSSSDITVLVAALGHGAVDFPFRGKGS